MKIGIGVLIILVLFSVNGVAREYTRWGLPEGAKMRLGKGRITEMRFSPNGNLLAAASSIGIWVYDVATHKEVALLASNAPPPIYIAFSMDGSEIAGLNGDGAVTCWDVDTKTYLRTFSVRTSRYGRSTFSADGGILACRFVGAVELWDVQTGKHLHTLSGAGRSLESIALSPDGSLLACGSVGGTVHLWDVKAGEELHTLAGHTDRVVSVAFSRGGGEIVSGSSDGSVQLWNTETGEHLRPLIKTDYVTNLTFNPKGDMLAIGLLRHEVELWKLKEMWGLKETRELQHRLTGHGGLLTCLIFHPADKTLASASWDGTVRLWNPKTGKHLHMLTGHASAARDLEFSQNGRLIAGIGGYGDTIVDVWDAVNGAHLQTFSSRVDGVERIIFRPDGKMIASMGRHPDKIIRLWNPRTSERLHTLSRHTKAVTSAAFSPDGRTLASGSWDNTVRLWDTYTAEYRHELVAHDGYVLSVAFSPDGRTLASGSGDGKVRLWDLTSDKLKRGLTGHTRGVNSVVFSPDATMLASASVAEVRLWDFATGTHVRTLNKRAVGVERLSFSSDGSILVCWSRDKKVRFFEADTGELLRTLSGSRHLKVLVAFGPNGSALFANSRRGFEAKSVQFKDGVTGTEVFTLPQGVGGVSSIAFSPDGTTLATGGWDGTVLLWDSPFASTRGGASGK